MNQNITWRAWRVREAFDVIPPRGKELLLATHHPQLFLFCRYRKLVPAIRLVRPHDGFLCPNQQSFLIPEVQCHIKQARNSFLVGGYSRMRTDCLTTRTPHTHGQLGPSRRSPNSQQCLIDQLPASLRMAVHPAAWHTGNRHQQRRPPVAGSYASGRPAC